MGGRDGGESGWRECEEEGRESVRKKEWVGVWGGRKSGCGGWGGRRVGGWVGWEEERVGGGSEEGKAE